MLHLSPSGGMAYTLDLESSAERLAGSNPVLGIMRRKKRKKRRNKGVTKSDSQRDHAKKRFLERYGMNFNADLRREFIKLIQTNQCHFVERQSNRVTVFDVIYDGEVFRVVYDKSRQNIVTVFPDAEIIEEVPVV